MAAKTETKESATLTALLNSIGAGPTTGNSDAGLCTVPITSLVTLLSQVSSQAPIVDRQVPFLILSSSIQGETLPTCARFKFSFTIAVHNNEWTTIKLIPSSGAITNTHIGKTTTGMSESSTDDDEHDEKAMITVFGEHHCFLVKKSGQYLIEIEALFNYSNKAKTQVELLNLQPCSRTSFAMTVRNQSDVQITVEPCLQSETIFDEPNKDTKLTTNLPPTTRLIVKWTEKLKDDITIEETTSKQPLSILVEHEHLFSVGEGMLLMDSLFRYDVRNGTISSVEIIIPNNIRVLSVECLNLKRWDVTKPTVDGKSEKKTPPSILRIAFDHGLDGKIEISIDSEMELPGSSCEFICPVFSNFNETISREKGFIAIESRTTIELDQFSSCSGCVLIDVEELSSNLRNRATNPILLAYKYLIPDYLLKLAVKKTW